MLKLFLRRTSTKDQKPTVTKPAAAGELAQGELWLNNNHETPGLFARADDDSLIEFPSDRFLQDGTNAKPRTYLSKLKDVVSVKDFGAVGDGVADDTIAIQAAINYAQSKLSTVWFPPGEYKVTTTLRIDTSPILLCGSIEGVWQQGSAHPAVMLTWTGGAQPMFTAGVSNIGFNGFAAQNKGAATDFLHITFGTRYRFHRMSWVLGTGTTRFSRSIIYCPGSFIGYSTFSSCQFGGKAPKFLFIDSDGTAAQTPIAFSDRCIFETVAGSPSTVVYVKGSVVDALNIEGCTFNQQGGELTIVDTTDTPTSVTIDVLLFKGNEWDYSAGTTSTDRMMRLTNVTAATIEANHFQCGGFATAAISLVNSRVSRIGGNWIERVVSAFLEADASSTVFAGHNSYNVSNVGRLVADAALGYVPVPWAANTFILPHLGNPSGNTMFVVAVTGATSWQLAFRHADNVGIAVPGQMLTINIRNETTGAIASPSYPPNVKLAGASYPLPAAGSNRSITFWFDGKTFSEVYRTAADIPN